MKKHQKSGSARRGLLFLAVTLLLLAILVGVAVLWERELYTPAVTTPPESGETEATVVPETQPTEDTMPTVSVDAMKGKQVLNILITGQDRRDVDSWVSGTAGI